MNTNCIEIDGSMGEGGGQVLRASLALSISTGKPFHIRNIRSGRPKPGLKRQHLTCVLAAAEISGAEISGAEPGSTELSFFPGGVRNGEYRFDVGSGGSCTLVLQAIIPPLLTASGPSQITVSGGTHVPHAPVFEFMQQTLFPWLEKLGPKLSATMARAGFMQVGGGSITVRVEPASKLSPVFEAGEGKTSGTDDVTGARADIYLANLDPGIAMREAEVLLTADYAPLGLDAEKIRIHSTSRRKGPEGPGNAVLVSVQRTSGTTVCSDIGWRGRSAETVAREAALRALDFITSGAPVDQFLADQLLVPLALAGGGAFVTERVTLHAQTCMDLLPLFTPIRVTVEPHDAKNQRVELRPEPLPVSYRS